MNSQNILVAQNAKAARPHLKAYVGERPPDKFAIADRYVLAWFHAKIGQPKLGARYFFVTRIDQTESDNPRRYRLTQKMKKEGQLRCP